MNKNWPECHSQLTFLGHKWEYGLAKEFFSFFLPLSGLYGGEETRHWHTKTLILIDLIHKKIMACFERIPFLPTDKSLTKSWKVLCFQTIIMYSDHKLKMSLSEVQPSSFRAALDHK